MQIGDKVKVKEFTFIVDGINREIMLPRTLNAWVVKGTLKDSLGNEYYVSIPSMLIEGN